MLSKLIKYDMKSLNRFLPVLHLFILLSSIMIRVFITGRIKPQTSSEQTDFLIILCYVLYFTMITALSTGTYLIAGIRFYKNMFSDEGYLTKTLPITNGMHLLSKTIAGSIWAMVNMCFVYLCSYVVIWTPYIKSVVDENKDDILQEFGFVGKYAGLSFSTVLLILLLFSCFGAISSIIMIYASVALGQLFSSHRVLGAVVSYFVISTLISVLSVVAMALLGSETRLIVTSGSLEDEFNLVSYMIEIMKISAGLMIITSVILYVATHCIMNKKINLI
ncbi:hypothetical protein FMM74_005605 [Lachnospiraceae bacterium MD308]|nr:hypothetical protein [Lachnospiraceae bacterium MD308]